MVDMVVITVTVHTTEGTIMVRDRLRMSMLPLDQTLTLKLMAGVSCFYLYLTYSIINNLIEFIRLWWIWIPSLSSWLLVW